MRIWRLAGACLLTLAALPGCQTFYSYRPITVMARDAETKQPLAGAEIHVSYPLLHPSQAPYESSSDSDAQGVAHVRAAPSGPAGVLVEVKAKGYLYEQRTLGVDTVQNLKPAGLFENVERRPADLVIDVYANPRPVVELVLPAHFHGLIKAQVKAIPEVPQKPGERVFRYAVKVDGDVGEVQVIGPPLVERVQPLDYRAVAHDGAPLKREAKGLETGFYAIKSDARYITFFVGTRAEYDNIIRADMRDENTPTRSKSGGGGGGRHGGRHGQGQTDPSSQ